MRSELRPFLNKKMTVQGVVTEVFFQNKLDLGDTYRPNVRVLLKDVRIGGVKLEHIWIYERKKNYEKFKYLIGEEVKFKAVVTSYVKENNGVYKEDYGIKHQSNVMKVNAYNKAMEQIHKI